MATAVAIMAKAPLPGVCKTRLARQVGVERATALYRGFLLDTVDLARRVPKVAVSAVCPDAEHAAHLRAILPSDVAIVPQEGEGLLAGLAWAFDWHLKRGFERVVLIDGDSPTLPSERVIDAIRLLAERDLVLGPCDDGGYYLIGARALHPELFFGVSYRSETICAEKATRAQALGLSVGFVDPWYDVDTGGDFERLLLDLRSNHAPAPHTRAYLHQEAQSSSDSNTQYPAPSTYPDPQGAFCPHCGGPLSEVEEEGRTRQHCARCERIIYCNPVPAAGGVVERDGRVLLVRRKHEPWRDYWCFPSGFVEYDEDVEGTARREVQEETGLEVAIRGIFGAYSYFDDPRKNGIIILFRSTPVGGVLRAGDDASDARFFAPDELPAEVGFASHRRALAQWLAERR